MNISLQGAPEKMNLSPHEFTSTLAQVLRRYIFFMDEKDIEYDIQLPDNINQYYMINNYSKQIPEVLEVVSIFFVCLVLQV